ncbi:hypothetical protein D3C76_1814310 [compost metagenome]
MGNTASDHRAASPLIVIAQGFEVLRVPFHILKRNPLPHSIKGDWRVGGHLGTGSITGA